MTALKRNYRRNNRGTGIKTFEQSVEDFWANVDSTNLSDPLKCWEWIGSRDVLGYGHPSFQGKQIGAHRASYLVHHGAIPNGLFVCHRCDNPSCVNPNHLFLGTQRENMIDCRDKKRLRGFVENPVRGEATKHNKLTEIQVREILTSAELGQTLARRFGVADATISRVRNRVNWKHVSV